MATIIFFTNFEINQNKTNFFFNIISRKKQSITNFEDQKSNFLNFK